MSKGCRAAFLIAALAAAAAARADELTGYVEFVWSDAESLLDDGTTTPIENDTRLFQQRYSLNLAHRLLPNLDLSVGGLFEHADTRVVSSGFRSDVQNRLFYPYASLALRTARYSAELAFERQLERDTVEGAPPARSQRDVYRASFAWSPPRLPVSRLEAFRTQERVGTPLQLARTDDIVQLTSDYRRGSVYALYRGYVDRLDDRIQESSIDTTSHSARLRYGRSWRHGRIAFSGDVGVDYRKTHIVSGAGEIEFPLAPVAGLFALDDTPENDALGANPLVADGNRAASAGIDLGLPAPTEDDRPRNIGLDLGTETPFNTLRLWVDRALPPEIAGALTFSVYVSVDQDDTWTLALAAAPAPFGQFDNRFELRTPNLSARYVKIVVAPLAATVPLAPNFPDIFVTELEGALRRPAADVDSSATGERVTLSLRTRLVEREAFYYEAAYFLLDSSIAPGRATLSNGLSWSRKLASIYALAARLARLDTDENGEDVVTHTLSASLGVQPLPTLRHNLVVSGSSFERSTGRRSFASVVLTNFLEVRRGIELGVTAGRTRSLDEQDRTATTRVLTVGATFVPHPTTTVTASLQDRAVEGTGSGGAISRDTRAAELAVAWRPYPALYLFGSHRADRNSDQPHRDTDEFNLSWAPFPDGALQFNLGYGETLRTAPETRLRRFVPSVRWNVTPAIYAEFSYSRLRSELSPGAADADVASATLRATF
ncbi:MAG TPA: hypothetical protein VJS92_09210 [Candidatus Polarisedimenticolaceae bacterium]|nr:hypothetical protein [Candidatus Polarisedimenticolaceae bacterium]